MESQRKALWRESKNRGKGGKKRSNARGGEYKGEGRGGKNEDKKEEKVINIKEDEIEQRRTHVSNRK